jgi:hypothetical protein
MMVSCPLIVTGPRGGKKGIGHMKKIAFGILIALVAASPAAAAKKKQKQVKAEPTVFERNEAGYRFVRDSMPVYWPTAFKVIYYSNPANRK